MKPQHDGGYRSWGRHGAEVCPLCGGTGIVTSNIWREKARRGGVKSFLSSLQPGRLSMRDRGKCGGRPKALTIEEIERRDAAPGPLQVVLRLPPPNYSRPGVVAMRGVAGKLKHC